MASISSRNPVDAVLRVERMSFQDAGGVEPGRVHRGDSAAKDKLKPPAWSSRVMARTRFNRPGYDRCPAAPSEPWLAGPDP